MASPFTFLELELAHPQLQSVGSGYRKESPLNCTDIHTWSNDCRKYRRILNEVVQLRYAFQTRLRRFKKSTTSKQITCKAMEFRIYHDKIEGKMVTMQYQRRAMDFSKSSSYKVIIHASSSLSLFSVPLNPRHYKPILPASSNVDAHFRQWPRHSNAQKDGSRWKKLCM